MPSTVEVCVDCLDSALAALEGGADRIELCDDLSIGGVTPEDAVIEAVCRSMTIPVHVLIRPRGGDFVYSEAEIGLMERQIDQAKALGARGIVVGALHGNGSVDSGRTARLIAAARPLSVTFHKAFDEVDEPYEALETLITLGVARVLTSGQSATAYQGIDRLADLRRRASPRLTVLAGGRITEAEIPALIGAGIVEIHVGSAACSDGITDPEKVRRIVHAAREAFGRRF